MFRELLAVAYLRIAAAQEEEQRIGDGADRRGLATEGPADRELL
jgi:hypothetical protein